MSRDVASAKARVAAVLVVGLTVGCSHGAPGTPSVRPSVQAACAATVHAYAHARDAVDADAYGALFTADAIFRSGESKQVGRAAIVEALKTRGAGASTRHLVGSVMIAPGGPAAATGLSYALVLDSAAEADAPAAPFSAARVLAFVRYEDVFVVEDGLCRFAARTATIDMQRPPP